MLSSPAGASQQYASSCRMRDARVRSISTFQKVPKRRFKDTVASSACTDRPAPLLSCDTLVAFPHGSGHAIFGKNSDRGTFEAQPLESASGALHPAGSQVRCQYL